MSKKQRKQIKWLESELKHVKGRERDALKSGDSELADFYWGMRRAFERVLRKLKD